MQAPIGRASPGRVRPARALRYAPVIDWLLRNLALWFGLIIVLAGVVMFRTSKRDRGMAAVIVVLGLIALYFFLTSPAHAPIIVGTPSAGTPAATPSR